ncbi:MAG: TIGR02206 family membrane protein [Saprospiraceae bacterium]|nr:TIGR02206 family membrane protein [Saprospiraceae bacterium]
MQEHYVVPILSEFWIWGIVLSVLVFSTLLWFGQYALRKGFEMNYRRALAGVFIIREIYLFAYTIQQGQFTIQDSLPFHLCNISYIFLIIFLLKPSAFLFEFLIMLSLAGAIQSLITPELTHGFSPYFLVDFYFSHAAIIFVPLYGYFVLKMVPRTGSWLRVFLFGNFILICVYFINLVLDSNYIYLMRAPIANNPMILRPYPMHLVGFQIFGLLHILLIYWLTRKFKYQKQTI